MNIQPKFDLVNQQSDHRIMQGFRLREAEGFSCQSLNPGSEIQIFTFNLLSVVLTHLMLIAFKVTLISPPIIGVITANAKGLQQGFQGFKHLILAFAKHISQYGVGGMIDGIPEPTLIGFVADK